MKFQFNLNWLKPQKKVFSLQYISIFPSLLYNNQVHNGTYLGLSSS